MKKQSLEICAKDFVNVLKKSTMTKAPTPTDSPVRATKKSKWDLFIGNEDVSSWWRLLGVIDRQISSLWK